MDGFDDVALQNYKEKGIKQVKKGYERKKSVLKFVFSINNP